MAAACTGDSLFARRQEDRVNHVDDAVAGHHVRFHDLGFVVQHYGSVLDFDADFSAQGFS